ncbi:MAG: alpha/beta fold hydrolase [Deltaproteobacteria bacterium]|nr:alpha/beta fold hydrolase [Deltaproteobacteria bacterium]MBW2385842.1 alpha/beta fold hydrolase [Deltaproteobacteria bacterium]MBW2695677.1 alpha/beta fold hydrolase [Deltaproteobacteria bacterium]
MEEFVAVSDGTLWTQRQGQGPPVVLLPGGPGCCDYLGPVADLLADRFTTLRYEPRGCGRSTRAGRFDLDECVKDLERIRMHFGWTEWCVLGHSWGANLGLLLAILCPESVRALVYLSGNGIQNDRQWNEIYAVARDAGEEHEPEWLFEPNPDVNRKLIEAWQAHVKRPAMLCEIAAVAVPTLVLYGERDIRPAWPAEQLASLMPNARFELLADADHYVWRAERKRMQVLLVEFLSSL